MKLNLVMMRMIAATWKKKKRVVRKAQKKNLMKKIPMIKVGNDCRTTALHVERSDLPAHYCTRLCVGTVVALLACGHLQKYHQISKIYKAKMCFRLFCATLIFGPPIFVSVHYLSLTLYIVINLSLHLRTLIKVTVKLNHTFRWNMTRAGKHSCLKIISQNTVQ